MTSKREGERRARQRAADEERRPQQRLIDRLAWRIDEWVERTGTSRPTVWRHARNGTLKVVYQGQIPFVPRSEAVRLGFIEA